jgi:hypothetical protein
MEHSRFELFLKELNNLLLVNKNTYQSVLKIV